MTFCPNRKRQGWNAEDYAANSSAQLAWARELIGRLELHGSETILDIGCGDGKVTALLAERVRNGKVLGIDLAEDMVVLASERYPAEDWPNLSFARMDASDIHLPRWFDVAFSNAALHWVPNQHAVLRGVYNSLRPGGRILFQMGGRGNAAGITDSMTSVIKRPRWETYFRDFTPPYRFFGPEEYQDWLLETGIRPVRVELVPKDMQHEGTDGLTGWLRTTWFPYTDRLPAEMRNAFLREVVETYLPDHPVDANGRTHVNMVRLEVEACIP